MHGKLFPFWGSYNRSYIISEISKTFSHTLHKSLRTDKSIEFMSKIIYIRTTKKKLVVLILFKLYLY